MTRSTESNAELVDAIDKLIENHDGPILGPSKIRNPKSDQNMVEMRKLIGQCREMDMRINTMVLENNKKYASLVEMYISAVEERVRYKVIILQ
jgi:hypothetical protein